MADVRMPDGTIIRNVPEGTTRSQLMARFAKVKAPAKRSGPLDWVADNVLSPINESLIGAAEGVYNVGAAITDPIARKVFGADAVRQAQGQRRNVVDTATAATVSRRAPVARTTGQIAGAMTMPGPKLVALGKYAPVASRAVQGAMGGAAVREVDDDAALPAAIGAVTNVIFPPTVSWLARTKPAQAVAGAVTNALGRLMGTVPEAAPVVTRPLAPLGRKAEARAARLKASGVEKPTTGMVTRDPNTFAFERNTAPIAGVGEDLGMQLRDVEQSLVRKGREVIDKQGGSKGAEETGLAVRRALQPKMDALTSRISSIEQGLVDDANKLVGSLGGARGAENTGRLNQEALDAKRTEMQRATSDLYEAVRGERGDEIVGRLDTLRERMTDPDIMDNAVFDQMREGISRRMERLGLITKGGTLTKGVTLKQAEELRKFIGGLGSNAEPGVRMMRKNLIDALDDDVVETVGDDAFKAARASAKARFDEFKKTFAGKIADEGIAPEALTRRLLSQGTSLSDLRAVKKSLLTGTEEQVARGQEAWRALRAQVVDDIVSGSKNAEGKISQEALAKNIEKFGEKLPDILDLTDFNALQSLATPDQANTAKAAADGYARSLAGRVLSDRVAPDEVTRRVLSSNVAEIRQLKAELLGSGGDDAWRAIKAQALDDFLSKSMNEEGKVLGGQLAREFTRQSAKFRELLDPADYKELRRLVLASRDATVAPPGSAVNYSGTGPMLANLFQSAKPKVRDGWLKFIAKHAAAGAVSFPAGNVAVEVGTRAAASAAQQRAASALMRRVELARSPEATAKAVEALKKASKTNPAASALLEKYAGKATGGTAAALAQ